LALRRQPPINAVWLDQADFHQRSEPFLLSTGILAMQAAFVPDLAQHVQFGDVVVAAPAGRRLGRPPAPDAHGVLAVQQSVHRFNRQAIGVNGLDATGADIGAIFGDSECGIRSRFSIGEYDNR
jgi:hypothetical protein